MFKSGFEPATLRVSSHAHQRLNRVSYSSTFTYRQQQSVYELRPAFHDATLASDDVTLVITSMHFLGKK